MVHLLFWCLSFIKMFCKSAPEPVPGNFAGSDLMTPQGSNRKCRGVGGFREVARLHQNLSSKRNSLRKAGQRKRESQLFFCTTLIVVGLPIGALSWSLCFNKTQIY